MPTYEYFCEKCGHEFEQFQSMADDPLQTCPKERCPQKRWGKGKVKRMIGAGAGLIFKGSGFYITDYRSEGYKEAAKKESSGGSESKPAAEKKSESGGSKDKAPASAPKKESKPAKKKE